MLDPNIRRRNVACTAACGHGCVYAISGMPVNARAAGEGNAAPVERAPA